MRRKKEGKGRRKGKERGHYRELVINYIGLSFTSPLSSSALEF